MAEASEKGERVGDSPIQDEYRRVMSQLAAGLDDALNPGQSGQDRKNGFVLLVFPFGDGPGRCNYISNSRREDVIVLLKEQITRLEGMDAPMTGSA